IARFAPQLSAVPCVDAKGVGPGGWPRQPLRRKRMSNPNQPKPSQPQQGNPRPGQQQGGGGQKPGQQQQGGGRQKPGQPPGSGCSPRRREPWTPTPATFTNTAPAGGGAIVRWIAVYGGVQRMWTRFLFEQAGL